jgi:uncharacterized GH25 family protein
MNIFPRSLIALVLLAPIAANAHKSWLLPSATVISKDQWVTFDAAVSNDLFYFNHVPMRTENLTITAPDGSKVGAVNAHTGQYRSVFDIQATQNGTYRIAIVNNGLFANWEEGGQPKRWRGTAETFAKEVPADAAKLQVTQAANRMETFITAGAPDTAALKPSGIGLELIPVTHPNDLYAGETTSFKFQIDGAPAAELPVTVIAGGSRYRDQPEEMQLKTDAEGVLDIQWPHAGMYWLTASIQDDKATAKPATARRAGYTATLEVLNP